MSEPIPTLKVPAEAAEDPSLVLASGKPKNDERLPRAFSLRFSTRGISFAVNAIVFAQFTFYATDALGLPAGLVGTLFLAAKVVDALTYFVAGFVIDRTNTRFGKGRPFELFIVPLWIFTVIAFSTPHMSTFWQAAYLFVSFFLIQGVCTSLLASGEAVYLRRAVDGEVHIAKVISRQGVVLVLAGAVASILLPQLMATWGTEPGGWTRIALVYGIPMILVGLIRFLTIKERPEAKVADAAAAKVSIKDAVAALRKNKFVFILGALILTANVVMGIGSIVGPYFFKYILGNLGLLSFAGLGALLIPVAYLFFPLAVRKIGAMNFVRVGLVVAAVGFAMVCLFPQVPAVVIVGNLIGSFMTVITLLINFFTVETMAYGEWKSGRRVDGLTTSLTHFMSQFGSGLASGIVGLVMGAVGYNGLAAQQSSEVNVAIIAMAGVIPLVLTLGMLALTYLYRLDRHIGHIRQDLEAGIYADSSELKL